MKWEEIKSRIIESIDSLMNGSSNMAAAKNYTDEMVEQMTAQYEANPTRETVDALAQTFGKTTRSIIAKLSREGIYKAQPRTTETGEPVISKSQFVSAIDDHFESKCQHLSKQANKTYKDYVRHLN